MDGLIFQFESAAIDKNIIRTNVSITRKFLGLSKMLSQRSQETPIARVTVGDGEVGELPGQARVQHRQVFRYGLWPWPRALPTALASKPNLNKV